jgi:hypothetical protein
MLKKVHIFKQSDYGGFSGGIPLMYLHKVNVCYTAGVFRGYPLMYLVKLKCYHIYLFEER